MIAACKCKNCGYIEMSSEDDVIFEIDFLEKKIVYICRQCKHNNTIFLEAKGTNKKGSLPKIGLAR